MSRFVHPLMLLCATLVSTSFIVGDIITEWVDPALLTLFRFLAAAVIVAPVLYIRHGLHIRLYDLMRYAAVSLCLVVFFWCMFYGLRFTSALNTSVIFTSVPLFSALFGFVLVGERLGKRRLVALGLAMAGAVWVIVRGDCIYFGDFVWNRGDTVFLCGCFAMGLYTPLIKLMYRGEPMEVMTFWVLVTGVLWLLPLAGESLPRYPLAHIPLFVWAGIGYLAVFTTVVTFYLTQYGTTIIGPTRTMSYSYFYPSLVLLIDLAAGRGFPGYRVIPGVLLVLGAMVVVQFSPTLYGKRQQRCQKME
jgi:drug/metabolite transporter (DMT)-like permease